MDLSIFENNKSLLVGIIKQISSISNGNANKVNRAYYSSKIKGLTKITKSVIYDAYLYLLSKNCLSLSDTEHKNFLENIKIKSIRTGSGVTPVTVMTKPYPCPGKCIYCPNEKGVPKSYIANEPGAQRAVSNNFDPYLQTFNRLQAYKNIGHSTDKVELILIGGTWSYYPKNYQIWFVNRCFKALNDFKATSKRKSALQGKKEARCNLTTLYKTFKTNENAYSRCVGLSIETRPDYITGKELVFLRKLGVTKIQMGVQSLNNNVLTKICRGHTTKETDKAFELLRKFGFKIQVHWMPNLPGSNPKADLIDYAKLVQSKDYIPDEIKIYPCSLIKNTNLYQYYKKGLWQPYTYKQLKELLKKCLAITPRYCRISRMIRDISSDDIVIGNKKSNLRQEIEKEMKKNSIKEIRFREIRGEDVTKTELDYKCTKYQTKTSNEYFLEMITKEGKIAGFLRLSIINSSPNSVPAIKELSSNAIIRELHVYGQSIPIGKPSEGKAQHAGIGTFLLEKAKKICADTLIRQVSIISSVGTKQYYRKLGFTDGRLYQHLSI